MQGNIISIHRELELSAQTDPNVRVELEKEGAIFYSNLQKKSSQELFDLLLERGLKVQEDDFIQATKNKVSARELLDEITAEVNHQFKNMWDEDIAHLAFVFLWSRINLDHPCIELFEECVYTGYEYVEKERDEQAIETWYKAYELLFYFIQWIKIKSLQMLKDQFEGQYELELWLEDFCTLLIQHQDVEGIRKLRTVCDSFIRQFEKEYGSLLNKLRINLAQSYFMTGEIALGESLYQKYLNEFPLWSKGWVAWSDNYWLNLSSEKNHKRAEEVLLLALDKLTGPDRLEVLERLKLLYSETEQIQKEIPIAEEIGKIQKALPKEETEDDFIDQMFLKRFGEKQTKDISTRFKV